MTENDRRIQVRRNNDWEDCEIEDLKKGDVFKAWEPDGQPMRSRLQGQEHVTTFVVTGEPKQVEIEGKKQWGVPSQPNA